MKFLTIDRVSQCTNATAVESTSSCRLRPTQKYPAPLCAHVGYLRFALDVPISTGLARAGPDVLAHFCTGAGPPSYAASLCGMPDEFAEPIASVAGATALAASCAVSFWMTSA